ncbi:MAG: hypothetical protein WC791_01540 [Candidatus Paceibacterota bacterium]|jgi:hypothetical protein
MREIEMGIGITILAILAGIFAGELFVLPVLVVLTIISIVVIVHSAFTRKELAILITWIIVYCALVSNLAMWVTYYVTTNQSWFTDFFTMHILR